MDSLIQYIQKSNLRERQYFDDSEFLLQIAKSGKAHETLLQPVPINFPNGNVVMAPSDLYFFFETEDLRNASPLFISQVGLVISQDRDVGWQDLFYKHQSIYFFKHKCFNSAPLKIDLEKNFLLVTRETILPMIKGLDQIEKLRNWPLWKLKSLVIQFFKNLNSMTYKLKECCERNIVDDDPLVYPVFEMAKDVVWNVTLSSFVHSFGAVLDEDLRRIFEDTFGAYRRKFNLFINSQSSTRPTIFDIFFDVDKLTWEVI